MEAAFVKLPRSTMHKVITTYAKLNEACSHRTALLLEGFQRDYVTQRSPKASDSPLQG